MSTEKTRSEILDKIGKLLSMAADVGSPNEAAIAARMAKKLMDEYSVTHADVICGGLSLNSFGEQEVQDGRRSFPAWLQTLAVSVAKYSDCRVKFVRAAYGRDKVLVFQGEKNDLPIAEYLYSYLVRQVQQLAQRHGVTMQTRNSFKTGCADEIVKALARMKAEERAWFAEQNDGKALVVVSKKMALLEEAFGVAKYRTVNRGVRSFGAYSSGREAAADVSIRRAVSSNGSASAQLSIAKQ